MKVVFLFFLVALGMVSCSDRQYNGSERYIVTGVIVKDNQPIPHELVTIGTYLSESITNTGIWSEPSYYEVVNTTYTDRNGSFKVSFPKGKYIYKLEVQNYEQVILDGKKHNTNYLMNLGLIDITE